MWWEKPSKHRCSLGPNRISTPSRPGTQSPIRPAAGKPWSLGLPGSVTARDRSPSLPFGVASSVGGRPSAEGRAKVENRKSKFEIRKSKVKRRSSAIQNRSSPQSKIENRKSKIENRKSKDEAAQSKIQNRKSLAFPTPESRIPNPESLVPGSSLLSLWIQMGDNASCSHSGLQRVNVSGIR
jgi:hypothetical protein